MGGHCHSLSLAVVAVLLQTKAVSSVWELRGVVVMTEKRDFIACTILTFFYGFEVNRGKRSISVVFDREVAFTLRCVRLSCRCFTLLPAALSISAERAR